MPVTTAFFAIFVTSCCGLALWRGRNSERLTAAALFASAVASALFQTSDFWQPESGILMIDLALLSYLIVLALQSDRFWPLYAAGFQVVGTLIHVARFADAGVWHSAYATAQVFWSYPVMAALMAGTWFEARYREW